MGLDGYVSFPIPIRTQAKTTYAVYCDINDANGNKVSRALTIVVP